MRIAIALGTFMISTNCWAYDDQMIKEQCKDKWGSDFSMQEYCINKEREAAEHVDKIRNNNSTGTTESDILESCVGEWPSEYSMMEYCYEKQYTSYKNLQGG